MSQARERKERFVITFSPKSASAFQMTVWFSPAGDAVPSEAAEYERVYPAWITAYQNGHGYEVAGQRIDQDIEVVSSILRESKGELPLPDRRFFRFEDVRPSFADFIREWLEYNEKFSEPLGCYASTIYHSLSR